MEGAIKGDTRTLFRQWLISDSEMQVLQGTRQGVVLNDM